MNLIAFWYYIVYLRAFWYYIVYLRAFWYYIVYLRAFWYYIVYLMAFWKFLVYLLKSTCERPRALRDRTRRGAPAQHVRRRRCPDTWEAGYLLLSLIHI